MIKQWLAPSIIIAALAAGANAAVYYGDHRYVMQETYEQSVNKQRMWGLMDRINEVKDKALMEQRDVSPAEQRQIERWEDEIRKLGDES